jgi:hypothetical protein
MADSNQVELIREGAAEWNRWRTDNDTIWPDLRGAHLSGANLWGANLSEADLRRAKLGRANLREANLRQANLIMADLGGANLSQANLGGAGLYKADLGGANLWGANLSEANLSQANLRGADLFGAYLYETLFIDTWLTDVVGLDACDHHGPSTLDHRTLAKSGQLPLKFLRGCGLPENLITYVPSLLNQAIQFYSCFISYNHTDRDFARRLHDTLQGRGIRCWLDEKQLLPGQSIYDEIDRGIRLWDKFLLCCSEHSLTSWWCNDEIEKVFAKEQALMKERKEEVLLLVPLDLDSYVFKGWKSGKATQIQKRVVADFKRWKQSHSKFEEQVEKLIRALRADENARERPPVSKLP